MARIKNWNRIEMLERMERKLKNQERKERTTRKLSRKCTTCGRPTSNYRCDACWREMTLENNAWYFEEYTTDQL